MVLVLSRVLLVERGVAVEAEYAVAVEKGVEVDRKRGGIGDGQHPDSDMDTEPDINDGVEVPRDLVLAVVRVPVKGRTRDID